MNVQNKSEILFLYETNYNIPNGDPFTGEQRYDDDTKRILVSDVRMKRFIRTYLEDIKNMPIYVSEKTSAGKTDSKNVLSAIIKKYAESTDEPTNNIGEIMKTLIDVRLFGGISTLDDKLKIEKKDYVNGHVQFTGPVQFALLNSSLNKVDLRMHQNTTHFTSKEGNAQGSIGTTTIVPYSLVQIHGWINDVVAKSTNASEEDLKLMFEALWYGTSGEGSSFSRSKIGQSSVLLLKVDYIDEKSKVYGLDKYITIKPNDSLTEEQIRSFSDYTLDLSKIQKLSEDTRISRIQYYTEIDEIRALFTGDKFEPMQF